MGEWEIRQRAAAALASADETLQRLQARPPERVERGEDGWVAPQRPEPASRAVRAPQRPVDGWQQRMGQIVEQRLGLSQRQLREEVVALAEEIGSVTGALGKKAAEQETRIKELENTVAELLAAVERRVDELEKHAAPGLRLIA